MIDKIIRFDDELYRAYLLKEIFLDSYYRYNYDNAEAFIETIIHHLKLVIFKSLSLQVRHLEYGNTLS